MTTTIGFIGLGAMGMPMARRLVRSGFSVRGFDPYTPENTADGIIRVASAREAASSVETLCVMVATPAQAEAALSGPDGALESLQAGSVVVIMATVGPEAAESFASLVRTRGALLVDAPVSGGVSRAADGQLLIMASGPSPAITRAQPILDALGSNVRLLGARVGDAQRMKLVNQLLCGVHIAAAAEALAFARSLGIDPAVAFDVVSSGAAASFMLDDRGPRMVRGEFETPRSAVDIFVKDLGLVCAATDLAIPIAEAARARFTAVAEAGNGRLDDSAVITSYAFAKEAGS